MEKFIEVKFGKQIDRYHFTNVSVDDFIDTVLIEKKVKVKDITKEEFESHPNAKWIICFNVDDRFECAHYVKQHVNNRNERKWKKFLQETASDGSLF